MAHRRAKLTVLGRRLLVDRILVDGMAVAHAADMVGVSRQTAWKWLRRFEAEGARSRGPELPAGPLAAGPAPGAGRRDPGRPPRAPLRTAPPGADRRRAALDHRRRPAPPRAVPAARPGRPDRHPDPLRPRAARRAAPHRRQEAGPDPRRRWPPVPRPGHRHAAVPRRRLRLPPRRGRRHEPGRLRRSFADERGTTCARFLLDAAAFFASHGVRIERVLTDNARNYTLSRAFAAALDGDRRPAQASPGRSGPRPTARPSASTGPCSREWAYVRRYDTNQARLDALPAFVDHYNQRRPHGSLNGQPPMTVLVNNVSGNHI